MLKYVAAAVGVFGTAHVVSSNLESRGTTTQQSASFNLTAFLNDGVDVLNRERGTATAGAVFTGASRSGDTIVIELTVDRAPQWYDATAASENLLKQVKPRWCQRKFETAFRRGAAVVYRYQTQAGLVLFDSRVDAQVCRLAS